MIKTATSYQKMHASKKPDFPVQGLHHAAYLRSEFGELLNYIYTNTNGIEIRWCDVTGDVINNVTESVPVVSLKI